ncbi:Kae1-like domain-containing protein [Asanoa siamensis]|uniref:Uncharacterized protein n=1 Tax=Asanoa siamensis TaxID=926357 RepID=A0ABQ4D0T4_9ACTN|nr:hypothetical protein [Asanoa siamensis]GIF77150.1 hypothetical protein Asi02nite_66680 [Asanoa siamensis]
MVITLPWEVTPTLAVGPGCAALGVGRRAWLGEFPDPATAHASLSAAAGVAPEVVAVDLHPGDPARRWAAQAGLPIRAVPRHHALVAAVLATHAVGPDEQVIGLALDHGGYGPDGATWGSEVLIAGYKDARRMSHLDYVRVAGATAARPHRLALAHLRHAGIPWDLDLPPVRACSTRERRTLAHQLETGYGCGATASLGHLLDALAALGLEGRGVGTPYPAMGLDPGTLVRAVVADLRRGTPTDEIAARVRATVVALTAEQVRRCADDTGLDVVALAGDVFDDPALTRATRKTLPGFTVLSGKPPLVLGRLLCAAAG